MLPWDIHDRNSEVPESAVTLCKDSEVYIIDLYLVFCKNEFLRERGPPRIFSRFLRMRIGLVSWLSWQREWLTASALFFFESEV